MDLNDSCQIVIVGNDYPLWQYLFLDVTKAGGHIVAYPYQQTVGKAERFL